MQSPDQSPAYTDDKSIVFAAISVSTVLYLLLVVLSTVTIISLCVYVGIKMHQKQIRNKGILFACAHMYECFSLRVSIHV